MLNKIHNNQIQSNSEILDMICFGKRQFHVLKESLDEDVRREYIKLIGYDKIDKIANEMVSNKKFRNFMLINLQNVFQYLRTKDNNKYACVISKQDTRETETLYQLTPKDVLIGFIRGQVSDEFVEQTIDPQIMDFNIDFTEQVKNQLSQLQFGSHKHTYKIDVELDIINQVEKLMVVAGFTNDNILITKKVALIKNSFEEEKLRAFFSLWQLNVFLEAYIAKLIATKFNFQCLTNKKIALFPNLFVTSDYERRYDGFIEIDVIAYDSINDTLIFIECKNGAIPESQLTKWIGRLSLIEKTQECVIDKKVIIATKYLDNFFRPVPDTVEIVRVNYFDNRDYRQITCFEKFQQLLTSSNADKVARKT